MPRINGERLIRRLRKFATFGAYKTGVHRPTYSPQDMESRRWLAAEYESVGLAAHIDGVGNVFGRSPRPGPAMLIGSHSESQNHAGWLDGAMGVIYGLEIAHAFSESEACRNMAIDPVAWSDEESHFVPFLGSRSFVGDLGQAEIDAARSRSTGQPLREALKEAGLDKLACETIRPERYAGYLEAHIEQGDSLEATGKRLGIVTSIVAIWQYRIVIEGVQNHAGTTRMAIRRDAGMAAVRLVGLIDGSFPKAAGPRSVWTMGRLDLEPGAPSIIPGRATMLFQFRDDEEATLLRLEETLHGLVREASQMTGCEMTIERITAGQPLHMDASFQEALLAAAREHCPDGYVRMPSGASHDAQILGRAIPAGMLFVPSIGGISHHWTEDTAEADLILGCQVLADAAERILAGR